MTTTFKFEARDASGRTVKGTVSANTQNDVIADLRRRQLTPVNIKKTGGLGKSLVGSGPKKKKTARRSSARKGELETFTRQLSTMLGAGIPLLESLEILWQRTATIRCGCAYWTKWGAGHLYSKSAISNGRPSLPKTSRKSSMITCDCRRGIPNCRRRSRSETKPLGRIRWM